MPVAVIAIIPTEEHREALLGDGRCGGTPPLLIAGMAGPEPWSDACWPPRWQAINDGGMLPLLWHGEPVPDGIARAVGVLGPDARVGPDIHWDPSAFMVRSLANALDACGIAAEIITEEKD